MLFSLRVEKWKYKKWGLYKFTFMPLIDKNKSNKLENTYISEKIENFLIFSRVI